MYARKQSKRENIEDSLEGNSDLDFSDISSMHASFKLSTEAMNILSRVTNGFKLMWKEVKDKSILD